MKIDPGGTDVPTPDRGFGDGDATAFDDGIFLNDDRVRAFRNYPAGEDAHRFAGADSPLERPAGGDLAGHLEPRRGARGIYRAHRIAVHRRHRLRRLGAQGRDVACQHTMMGRIQRDHLLRQRLGAREDGGKCIGNGHQGHG